MLAQSLEDQVPDEALMAQVMASGAEGQGWAFEELYRRHGNDLLCFVSRLVGDLTASADVSQETWLKVWTRRSTFAGPSFRAWLFGIAKHQSATYRRRQIRFAVSSHSVQDIEDASSIAPNGPKLAALEDCLAELTENQRLTVKACIERTTEALAQQLGKSSEALHKQAQRVRFLLVECVRRKTQCD